MSGLVDSGRGILFGTQIPVFRTSPYSPYQHYIVVSFAVNHPLVMVLSGSVLPREDDMMGFEKEASGRCLFYQLPGVQVVGGSNPLTPMLNSLVT